MEIRQGRKNRECEAVRKGLYFKWQGQKRINEGGRVSHGVGQQKEELRPFSRLWKQEV